MQPKSASLFVRGLSAGDDAPHAAAAGGVRGVHEQAGQIFVADEAYRVEDARYTGGRRWRASVT